MTPGRTSPQNPVGGRYRLTDYALDSSVTRAAAEIPVALPANDAAAVRLRAAYELTKPRMNFLVLVTAAVGYLAAGGTSLVSLLHALGGTALVAAGASVLNQWMERDADARMKRTVNRPLPAGVLSPAFAFWFGVLLGVAGTLWLALLVNPLSAGLAAATLLLYVLVYTPMKRLSPWCTLVGTVPGAIPPVIGVAAATGGLAPPSLSLFALLTAWQMPHFFGLATMFADDYRRGGFRMLPGEVDGRRRAGRQAVLVRGPVRRRRDLAGVRAAVGRPRLRPCRGGVLGVVSAGVGAVRPDAGGTRRGEGAKSREGGRRG